MREGSERGKITGCHFKGLCGTRRAWSGAVEGWLVARKGGIGVVRIPKNSRRTRCGGRAVGHPSRCLAMHCACVLLSCEWESLVSIVVVVVADIVALVSACHSPVGRHSASASPVTLLAIVGSHVTRRYCSLCGHSRIRQPLPRQYRRKQPYSNCGQTTFAINARIRLCAVHLPTTKEHGSGVSPAKPLESRFRHLLRVISCDITLVTSRIASWRQ